ncbi:MAG: Lrp/AsnC family transcriptional regulator [Opitutales bacterium]
MDKILKLILEGEVCDTQQMGQILNMTREEVISAIAQLKAEKTFLGWIPVLHPDYESGLVSAAIELKINPATDAGFDKLAQRISAFEQVDSCFLMSGAYDLLLFVKAKNLREIASFVYEHLAIINGVNATATHFFLKTYKSHGFLIESAVNTDRPIISA